MNQTLLAMPTIPCAARTPLKNLGPRAEQPVWIDDEFSCDSPIEVGVTLWRLIERDHRRIHGFGNRNAAVKNRHHQRDYTA